MTISEKIPEQTFGEAGMLQRERWDDVHRLAAEQRSVSEIARQLDLDRKTVRRCLRQTAWQPYQRVAATETLLREHAVWLWARAPAVRYSARILWQELRQDHAYRGSYETVKRFVRPLRTEALRAELTWTRFETPPGVQSQIDWGQARLTIGGASVTRHLFVLTLGFSRRGFYLACLDETLPTFLDAHERAFEYFGGHTREHLYDRPRTVCRPAGDGHTHWNPTFKAFADYWSFEPRLCQPYRAQTKGKVEAGVKYVRRNFLPGRTFRDDRDLDEQLTVWMTTIADVRIHGTTHERPIDRFAQEHATLVPTNGQPGFRYDACHARLVADDYLVSFETNRYSVPFALIGQPVEVRRRGAFLEIAHHGRIVAQHPALPGKYQVAILPEHGPGASRRTARHRPSTPAPHTPPVCPDVEIRDLTLYDTLCQPGGER